MANYLTNDTDLGAVADAIRTKGGTSGQLVFPGGFVDAIDAIETGGGGDYTAADFGDMTKPVGRVVFLGSDLSRGTYAFRTEITSFYAPNVNNSSNVTAMFSGCSKMQYLVLPKIKRIYNNFAANCSELLAIDVLGNEITGSSFQFGGCKKLATFIIRKTASVCPLSNVNAFQNAPFASNGTGGTLYVPSALISSYEAATNWSTILGYANNSIQAIEGSIYETQYADGTPIPTT